jgi:hypothetical protein
MYGQTSVIATAQEVLLARFGLQTVLTIPCLVSGLQGQHEQECEVAMQLNVFSWIDQESSETLVHSQV